MKNSIIIFLIAVTFVSAKAFKDIDWDTVSITYTVVGSPRSDTVVTLTGRSARYYAEEKWALLSSMINRTYKKYLTQARDEYQEWKFQQATQGNTPSQEVPQVENTYEDEQLYLDEGYNESTFYSDEEYNESELYPE